jgi:hypothetical protein
MNEQNQLTFGEKAVGISFNPGNNEKVETIKRHYANTIDYLTSERSNVAPGSEQYRMLSVAITESQTAQMWAVKAVTWQY